ncbi:hypothetical protein Q5752_003803 [Cryptotrichosporon argae]
MRIFQLTTVLALSFHVLGTSGNTYLIPGTYSSSTYPSPSAGLDENLTTSSSTFTLSPPATPLFFAGASYVVYSGNSWDSAYLPSSWYGLAAPGVALWGAVPDRAQLPITVEDLSVVYDGCATPCSHGTCSNATDTCVCATGWAGAACDGCASGHYGVACAACAENCTVCDDGLGGTGACLGTAADPSACGCGHGTCAGDGCVCAAGYTSNTTVSSTLCNVCADRFFADVEGNCLACPLGCTVCELQQGTNATAMCTACASTLALDTATPASCSASTSCDDGQYYDASSSSCEGCSAQCTSCTGPGTGDCLACASPRASLAGQCVEYGATGVCDSSLSGLGGVFVVDNGAGECNSCPAGCLDCYIPNFSTAADYGTLTCTACQAGYLLQNGACVRTCEDGYYASSASANGTCEACDSACSTCTSATYCLTCATGFASNGTCVTSCPSSSIASGSACLTCHPDCATCSSTSATGCTSCPASSPAFVDGRCVPACSSTQYLSGSTCVACAAACASCSGGADDECTSCADGHVLTAGTCVQTTCAFAPGLGVCLSSLATAASPRHTLWPLAFLGVALAALALAARRYVRRERARTRAHTAEFRDALEGAERARGLERLGLERVWGLERVRRREARTGTASGSGAGRLCDVFRKRRDFEMRPAEVLAAGQRSESWLAPPPPYAPSASSADSAPPSPFTDVDLASPVGPLAGGKSAALAAVIRADAFSSPQTRAKHETATAKDTDASTDTDTYRLGRTRVVSMGGAAGPPSPQGTETSLPPPRRWRVPLGGGEMDGHPVVRAGGGGALRDLWRVMGEGERREHAWI